MNNRPLKKLLCALTGSIGLASFNVHGDDTQLFMLNPSATTGLPNVLIIWDNTANWNQPFDTEKTALVDAFSGLDPDKYNVGLMMFTETGTGNSNADGAYVRAAVRKLSGDYKTTLSNLISHLDVGADKGNASKYGLTMWEAWQYFNGLAPNSGASKVKTDYTGNLATGQGWSTGYPTSYSKAVYDLSGNALTAFAGTQYVKPPSDGCQKNYIIFISNGPAADAASDTATATTALSSAGGATAAISLPAGYTAEQTVVADEWAKFMATHSLSDRAKIYTYTIDVGYPKNNGSSFSSGQGPDHSALLKSMAAKDNGNGKYYCYGDTTNALGDACAGSLKDILDEIFKNILAVNSVFSSVSLPVNVNVRGQVLNQVYMGVFRPDANGNPLWPGNLKAYTVGQTGTSASGSPIYGLLDNSSPTRLAVENTDTNSKNYGFINSNVTSFWTHTTSTGFWTASYYPDAQGKGGVQDAPDGEIVEKGGAAQRLRDFYSKTAGAGISINSSTDGRKLYTCVSDSGASCSTDAHLSTMPFTTANTNITTALLGLSGSAYSVSNLVRTEPTGSGQATATATAAGHPFQAGGTVTISGVTPEPSRYNATFTITSVSGNNFTFPITLDPVSPATGTITASNVGSQVSITGITRANVDSTTATVATASNTFTGAETLTISNTSSAFDGAYNPGANPNGYTGVSSTGFTINNLSVTPPSGNNMGGTGVISFYDSNCSTIGTSRTFSGALDRSSGSQSVTTTFSSALSSTSYNTSYPYVAITGLSSPYDKYNISCSEHVSYSVANSKKSVSFTLPISHFSHPLSAATGKVDGNAVTRTVTSLVRSGTTATATTSVAHGFVAGETINIAGATDSAYADLTNRKGTFNGSFTILSVPSTTTFTYTVTTLPASPAAGTITAVSGTGISRDSVINWTRGINVKDDDNANPSTDSTVRTSDVRGYLHGDVLHSRPVLINYNRDGTNRDIVVYYGANDGFLHAVKGGLNTASDATGDGKELWGFIAAEQLFNLTRLYTGTPVVDFNSPKPYFFDGPISSYVKYNSDQQIDGDSATANIYAAMRRGGDGLYAFDVKTPTDPILKWRKNSSTDGFGELGQTWSEAKVAKIKSCSGGTCTDRPVLIFGAGYDATADDASPQGTATMGRGIYVVDAITGDIIWMAGPSQPAHFPATAQFTQVTGMTYPIPSDIAVVDRNGDGYVDRLYAPDTGGNIWRINIDPAASADTWTVGKLASLRTASAATGSNNYRKFLFPPDVVFGTAYDSVLIGSGDREHPFDLTTENRFYMLKDDPALAASSGTSSGTAITEVTTDNNLCNVTNNLLPTDLTCTSDTLSNCQNLLTARANAEACLNASGNHGWYITFCQGEKVVNTPITLAGAVNFGTNVPRSSSCATSTSSNQCTPDTGQARLYFIDYRNGTPLADTNSSGTYTLSDRYNDGGGGFPPSGTQITTQICDENGENCKVTDIVCSGPKCLTPPTPAYGRRYRVFWKMDLDN